MLLFKSALKPSDQQRLVNLRQAIKGVYSGNPSVATYNQHEMKFNDRGFLILIFKYLEVHLTHQVGNDLTRKQQAESTLRSLYPIYSSELVKADRELVLKIMSLSFSTRNPVMPSPR